MIYLVAFFIYFALLTLIVKNSPYQKAYNRGAALALLLWVITMYVAGVLLVGTSGATTPYSGEELEFRLFLTKVVNWVSFFVWHLSLPLLFKHFAAKKAEKKFNS